MNSMVLCKNVTKSLGSFKLDNISFELPAGYILGVIGRNGCGKTTLLRCMMGAYRLLGKGIENGSGDVIIDNVSANLDVKKFKKQFGFIFNETPFFSGWKVKEVGQRLGRYYDDFSLTKYYENLKRFDIPDKTIDELSKGQKIKQQLAFALSYDAKVYFLDEPTGNLDVEFRDEFYSIVRGLVEDGTRSVVYASHLVEELEEFADYILWLEEENGTGSLKIYTTVDELKDMYRMIECPEEELAKVSRDMIVGGRKRESHTELLVKADMVDESLEKYVRYADLKEIMYYVEKGEVL